MTIFQVIAIAVVGAVLAVTLKNYKPEFAIGVSFITGMLLLFISADGVKGVFDEFEYVADKSGIDIQYFQLVIKVIGIAYITQFAAEICKDSGQNGIASKLETAGKIFVMVLTMPIINNFFELIISVLN